MNRRKLPRVRPTLACLLLVSLSAALPAHAKTVAVADATGLLAAIASASAGDEIVLADGTYSLQQSPKCTASGTPTAPIVVRAAHALQAKVVFDTVEGFHVKGPFWRFEGLDVRGTCANDSDCEHAFHVVGAAHDVALVGCRLVDFNAQLKVNADQVGGAWVQPNHGLVEGCEVFDTHPRKTSNPVTKLNIDTVDGWVVRGNFLYDGHKDGGNGVSYQAFQKGGGKNGVFEHNLVLCERDDHSGGTRIGLSFGGGGTGAQFCAPAFDANTPCAIEHTGGILRNNLIVNCSDVGIYLNQAKDTKVLNNTLVATSGVDFRFANTSGEADGNVLAGKLRLRDGGTFAAGQNLTELSAADFAAAFADPLHGDFHLKATPASWTGKQPLRPEVPDDYCHRPRTGKTDLGALQVSAGDCATLPPPAPYAPPPPPPVDEGATDAGTPPASDAGAVQAQDAGAGPDSAASDDSQTTADAVAGAAAGTASPATAASGCSSGHAHRSATLPLWLAMALVALSRRRRCQDTP